MARRKISFQKMQEFISRYEFEKLENEYFRGRSASRGFSQMNHFKVIAFGILEGINTLNDCVMRFNSYVEYLYHLGFNRPVALSTISDANRNRSSDFYRALFFNLLEKTKGKLKANLSLAVRVLDSTTITISDKRSAWASFRKNKFGIKVHVLLDEALTLVENMKITTAKTADVTVAKTFEFLSGHLYVMDRAYFDAAWLYKLNKNDTFFVMRLKTNIVYHTIKETVLNESNIVAIKTIQLIGPKSEAYCDHLQLYLLRDEKTGKTIEVITNNKALTAEEVSAIYRQRWQIEIFFRTLKQNLQIKRFFGRNENAIRNQIWIAMIVYLLLWNMHRLNQSKDNFLEFLRNFKSRLFHADPVKKNICIRQLRIFSNLPLFEEATTG